MITVRPMDRVSFTAGPQGAVSVYVAGSRRSMFNVPFPGIFFGSGVSITVEGPDPSFIWAAKYAVAADGGSAAIVWATTVKEFPQGFLLSYSVRCLSVRTTFMHTQAARRGL